MREVKISQLRHFSQINNVNIAWEEIEENLIGYFERKLGIKDKSTFQTLASLKKSY